MLSAFWILANGCVAGPPCRVILTKHTRHASLTSALHGWAGVESGEILMHSEPCMVQQIIFLLLIFTHECSCFQSSVRHSERSLRPPHQRPWSSRIFSSTAYPSHFLSFEEAALLGFLSYCQCSEFAADLASGEKHLAVRCLPLSFWTVPHPEFC